MTLRNTKTSYGSFAKCLHWLVAFMVIGLLIVGFCIDSFDKPFKFEVINLHKSIGLLLLGLMLIRTYWHLVNPRPALPNHMSRCEVRLAKSTHGLLLLCVLLMPIDGWVMSCAAGHPPSFFGLVDLALPISPNKALAQTLWSIHKTLAWIIIGLVSLHTLAALKHHFIDRDTILKRML